MDIERVVADSGVFIEYLRKKDKKKTVLYSLANNYEILISAVTFYELYIGATNVSKRDDVRILTEDLSILPFDQFVAKKASEIYYQLHKMNKMVEFRDIFIAATCLTHSLPLKTLNKKYFERIPEIRLA